MKVKDLIEMLKDYDEDAEIVIQSDDEGNGYRELRGTDEDFYIGDITDEPVFLSSYENVDHMAEDMDECTIALSRTLKDIVVLY